MKAEVLNKILKNYIHIFMQNKKNVLIAGVTGQDGFYLSKLLIKKKFKVIGLSRKYEYKKKNLEVIKTNYSRKSIKELIKKYKPIQIYNFAAFSNPVESWKKPKSTIKSIVDITLNFLENLKEYKNIKFFNASTSEIFKPTNQIINESSAIFPENPYGIAKASAHFLVSAYRKNYNIFAVNGIFFNHDSPHRKKKFLFKHIILEANKVKNKKIENILLKDPKPIRDFGYSGDFMVAAHQILSLKKPDDFIIATGKSISVKNLAEKIIRKMKIPPTKIKYIKDYKYSVSLKKMTTIRKIHNVTGWKPKVSLEKLILLMIESEKYRHNNN